MRTSYGRFKKQLAVALFVLVAVTACRGGNLRDAAATRADPPPATANAPSSSTPAPTDAPTAVRSSAPTTAPTAAAIATSVAPATRAATSTSAAAPTVTPIVLGAPPARLTRYEIVKARQPKAVCNDGTTAIFYYRRGSGSGANKWILWFKGGFDCYDAASCTGRDPTLVSANAWPQRTIDNDGILSELPSHNPDFYNWNQVQMIYCSSDVWTGMREDSANDMKWFFSGHYIVDAILDAVMDPGVIGRPTLREATHVLITGSSAGAVGVRNNVDRLAEMLSFADVRAVTDSGLGVYVNPAYTAEQNRIAASAADLWKPAFDLVCAAPGAVQPPSCPPGGNQFGGGAVSTPLFARHDIYDPVIIVLQQLDIRKAADRPLIQTLAAQLSDVLKQQSGAFGTAAGDHITLANEGFYTYKVDGLTFAQVLGNWYFNRAGPKVVVEPTK